ncbi:hypothetical protein N7509_013555 [Penicillium cosmopolitanum]|uniref:Uncharacterized protein n=1 Tax=Penicillium cosmopolitanum TaxID=1131564 RepID=A0A9W9SG83_9EURO|nr:uncharacterized protein N7509_013555 [Penicillium cosmopolitanum]KAJ5376669.1 hypothetical protein N7509_013555 [Penicillium cosmopolitanum]
MTSANPPPNAKLAQRIQRLMAVGYSGMGSWCLLFPSTVIGLSLVPKYATTEYTPTLLMRCFGAQATTCGVLLGTANMTPKSFVAFGLAMIPYLGFNYWFGVGPGKGVFTSLLWLDFVGNVTFCAGSFYCAWLLGRDEEEVEGGGRLRKDE